MHELFSIGVDLVLVTLAFCASMPCGYLLLLTVLSARLNPPPQSSRKLCFDVIVPAHNEAANIRRTIENLCKIHWPRDLFRVVVVADNCTDTTADVAQATGAEVLVRNDPQNRGKGYALAYAFEHSRAAGRADAVVVVDADSEVSPNLLEAFACRIECGAVAVQAHYGVLNAFAAWRTRLMSIALGSFHTLRSRGRERLNASCGIRGNGWCVTHTLLRSVPYRAFSLTEDIEFGIELGLSGYRVAYCEEGRVNGEMVTSAAAAKSQRQRWEGGRVKLVSSELPRLASGMFRKHLYVCADLAIDLLVPPLSYLVLNVLVFALVGALVWRFESNYYYSLLAVFDAVVLVLYVLRGWQLSEVGMRGLLDLARAPIFVFWKLMILVSGKKVEQWVRTDRERL